jgi:hypothetical protein
MTKRKSTPDFLAVLMGSYNEIPPELGAWVLDTLQSADFMPDGVLLQEYDRLAHEMIETEQPGVLRVMMDLGLAKRTDDGLHDLKGVLEILKDPELTDAEKQRLASYVIIRERMFARGLRK